jgi:polycomb protein SUZ12
LENEPQSKRRRVSDVSATAIVTEETTRLFGAELIVYDRHSRCLLIDGDYELAMKEINSLESSGTSPSGTEKSSRIANTSWSTLDSPSTTPPLSILAHGPMLKFRLEWANDPISALVDRLDKSINPPSYSNSLHFFFLIDRSRMSQWRRHNHPIRVAVALVAIVVWKKIKSTVRMSR